MKMAAAQSLGLLNPKSICSTACILAFGLLATAQSLHETAEWFGLALCSALAALLLIVGARARLTVRGQRLDVGALPYRKRVTLADLHLSAVRRLEPEDPFRLRWRLNGIGLPGMCLGRFSTNTGRPVFAAVAGRRHRVLIPTRLDFDILVTVADPDALVRALKEGSPQQCGTPGA